MIVKAVNTNIKQLPENLNEYAFTQNESGELDVNRGRHYVVYALKKSPSLTLYLVHTDRQNTRTLWWMPAQVYELIEPTYPAGWTEVKIGNQIVYAYPFLHQGVNEEAIIDGDLAATNAYLEEMIKDDTAPTNAQLARLNEAFEELQREKNYAKELNLAKERGYERPSR